MEVTNHFPKMVEMRQSFPPSRKLDFQTLIQEQFSTSGMLAKVTPGMKIAVGVGSRGISNLHSIVKAVVEVLDTAGTRPFLIPAMGSHGGATPEGQAKVLAEYGITPESMGVPIDTSMAVRRIGATLDSLEVVFSEAALQADGIVVINRIKPHTDFRGPLGSGIQKMLTIGFGKQIGARNAHAAASRLGHEIVIREFAKVILDKAPVLCGVGIVEDQHHQTAEIEVIPKESIPAREEKLLSRATSLLARLPFDEIDLLIVDQIGKEISGTGMDTNVIGRDIIGYSASLRTDTTIKPHVFRIFVRDLTPATNGNGIGIGLADFTTSRAVKALDLKYTYVNALTSIGLLPAKIPIYFDTDREALQQSIASLATDTPEKLRVVRIANTLNLDRFLVSEACANLVKGREGVTVAGMAGEMQFDNSGNLAPL
ncbi:MAG TPA: hypothetical protein VGM27_12300 [Acidobacteriaceae bacterium]